MARGRGSPKRERPGYTPRNKFSPRQRVFATTVDLTRSFVLRSDEAGGMRPFKGTQRVTRRGRQVIMMYYEGDVLFDARDEPPVESPRGPDFPPVYQGKLPGPIVALDREHAVAYVTTDPTLTGAPAKTQRALNGVTLVLRNRGWDILEVHDVLNTDPASNLQHLAMALRQEVMAAPLAKVNRELDTRFARARELERQVDRYCRIHRLPHPPVTLGDLADRVTARKVEMKIRNAPAVM